jgi:hypothetical protein
MRIGYLPPDSISRFTADGLYIEDDGKEVEIKYLDLVRVTIDTTDQGPWIPDCFWVMKLASGREVIIENDDPSAMLLLGALQKAMASTDYASFLAWKRGA